MLVIIHHELSMHKVNAVELQTSGVAKVAEVLIPLYIITLCVPHICYFLNFSEELEILLPTATHPLKTNTVFRGGDYDDKRRREKKKNVTFVFSTTAVFFYNDGVEKFLKILVEFFPFWSFSSIMITERSNSL